MQQTIVNIYPRLKADLHKISVGVAGREPMVSTALTLAAIGLAKFQIIFINVILD